MCKVCTGYHDTSEIEYCSSACTVDDTLAKACGVSVRTGVHIMPYISFQVWSVGAKRF